jgi:hypothetical protein
MANTYSEEEIFEDTNRVLWWSGWKFLKSVLLWGVGLAVALLGIFGSLFAGFFIGILVGAIISFIGSRHINERAPKVRSRFRATAPEVGVGELNFSGEDGVAFNFEGSSGEKLFVKPAEEYRVTTAIVGNSSVALHGGVKLDMPDKKVRIVDESSEFYYDQITSVQYEAGVVTVRTSDGDSVSRPARRKPEGLINELQTRVRDYKAA